MKFHISISYHTDWGQDIYLLSGDHKIAFSYNPGDIWSAEIEEEQAFLLENYRYAVVRNGIIERLEWGRHLHRKMEAEITDAWIDGPVTYNGFNRPLSASVFSRDGYRGAGVAVPVFSLRSGSDFGTGEFLDLKLMVEWAFETGQNVIQLLPINDTSATGTWTDSYPYSAISAFALNPLYINLQEAGVAQDETFQKEKEELNAIPYLDYDKVYSAKMRLLHELFESKGKAIVQSLGFKKFADTQSGWLDDYALFCALRDHYGTADFTKWKKHAVYSEDSAKKYSEKHPDEINFYKYIQFLADEQLKSVCYEARMKSVHFKGDLPIGISRNSVDAWRFPSLFNMDSQAGAPPDFFSCDGQNWGFPTYNWEEMEKDNFAWWRARLRKMSEYFDLFRIDHILGFFRIWEIPLGQKSGKLGHFNPAIPFAEGELSEKGLPIEGLFVEDPHKQGYFHPCIAGRDTETYKALDDTLKAAYDGLYYDFFFHRHESFWAEKAMHKFPILLGCTEMLACGEDLGMVPECVKGIMESQGILSLEVQRMPKRFGECFTRPETYPYKSVCTTSSHDINPLRAWWKENQEVSSRYWKEILRKDGEAPEELDADSCREIVRQHLASPAMLAILPIQDYLATDDSLRYCGNPSDERINDPAETPHYWKYRLHLNLEKLLSAKGFNDSLKKMIQDTGRG